MVPPVLEAERLDIKVERDIILESLKTGDFNRQKLAFDRLAVLAENHFPPFLPNSVNLISDANQLDDRARERLISPTEQGVEVRRLVSSAVELLAEMSKAAPLGRIEVDRLTPEEKTTANHQLTKYEKTIITDSIEKSRDEDADDDLDLVNLIVRTREPRSKGKLIFAQDITKQYPRSPFRLRPITFELNRGEILGIVGVNASGKTTLLRMLLGDIKISSGQLTYPAFAEHGGDVGWINIKQRIGYVSQTLPKWPGKVYDNLCYIASIYGHGFAETRTLLDLLLKRYGLDKFKDATWDEISGGYKTRFEIVRALLSKPDILILDEPLAYLDIISQQVVLSQLRQLARNRGRPIGVIITSQQLYEIEAIADRLLVLDGGTTLFSNRVKNLSDMIDHLVIEFSSNGPMVGIKDKLKQNPHYLSLLATETGYISVFRRQVDDPTAGTPNGRALTFNDVLKILGGDFPGELSYARDISNSCRILFEPRMAQWLDAKLRLRQ